MYVVNLIFRLSAKKKEQTVIVNKQDAAVENIMKLNHTMTGLINNKSVVVKRKSLIVGFTKGMSAVTVMTKTVNASTKTVADQPKPLNHILMVKTYLMFVVKPMKLCFVLLIIRMAPVVLLLVVPVLLIVKPMIWMETAQVIRVVQ